MYKVCKNCKRMYEGSKCPVCGSTDYATEWKGEIVVFNPEKSEIAKFANIKLPGRYALKLR